MATPIEFVLDQFNNDLTMETKAVLPAGEAPGTLEVDAVATYKVSVDAMKSAFFFQSDSRDVSNADATDTKYFVSWPATYVLNPSHAFVATDPIALSDAEGLIPVNRMLVKHDFIRHIAKELFNTHLAVDLFDNETEISQDLASKGNGVWVNNIKVAIDAVSAGGSLTTEGYTTNALDTSANLCRVLFNQILATSSSRFDDLDSLAMPQTDTSNNNFYIPFINGDSISFKVVFKTVASQNDIISGRTDPVPDRSYRIKIDIVTEPVNVAVDDAGELNSSAVVIPV